MITDQARIVQYSESNPVKMWPWGKPTFNTRRISLIDDKKYYQNFLLRDILRTDILFNTGVYKPWDPDTEYNIGDRVYDEDNLTRWISKINTNIGNNPATDIYHTYWDHSSLGSIVDDWLNGTIYNNGDRSLFFDGSTTECLTNPDFAGTIAPWNGNFANGGTSGQNWTYASGSASLSISAEVADSRGLKQTIIAASPDDHYHLSMIGTLTMVGSHSTDFIIKFYDVSNVQIGSEIHFGIGPVSGTFNRTFDRVIPNLSYVVISIETNVVVTCAVALNEFHLTFPAGEFKVYQSIADANTGNDPSSSPAYWEQVEEATGLFKLYYVDIEGGLLQSLDFNNIGTTNHQFIEQSYLDMGLTAGKVILRIWDDQQETYLAASDCFNLWTEFEPSVLFIYTNSNDFDELRYETGNPSFYMRLKSVFYDGDDPLESEDLKLSSGVILSLKAETTDTRLLNIVEYLPRHMHKLIVHILMHDSVSIRVEQDGEVIEEYYWKRNGAEYEKSVPEASTLSRAKIVLSRADGVLTNISKSGGFPAGRVFSNEFSPPFG